MEPTELKAYVVKVARKKQRQIEARLKELKARFGHPLPSYLAEDPKLVKLWGDLVSAEYELYRVAPELDPFDVYDDDLVIADYFYADTLV